MTPKLKALLGALLVTIPLDQASKIWISAQLTYADLNQRQCPHHRPLWQMRKIKLVSRVLVPFANILDSTNRKRETDAAIAKLEQRTYSDSHASRAKHRQLHALRIRGMA